MTDPGKTGASSSRRDFFRTTAAGAVASGLIVPSVHAAGSDAIKVGLIGCGGRGSGAAENICEAAGTSFNVKLYALGDVFEDRLRNCYDRIQKSKVCEDKHDISDDRKFVGFDAYQKVIDCCDLVMLATPPGFRPQHLDYAVKAGKHIFTEKPVAVDGPGYRKVIAAYEEARKKNLGIVAGTQRRHQAGYIESIKRIHDGALGDLVTARVHWDQGNIWAVKRQPGWNDMEYQLRNWYHFTWLCGDCIVEQHVHNIDVALWALQKRPIRCVGYGGQQVNTAPEYGESFDHFAVDFEFPDDIHILSTAKQINNTSKDVSETIVGTKGFWKSNGYRFGGGAEGRVRVREVNPYVQEHIDLLTSIQDGKPINELKQVAESCLTAIMGRMAAYTGQVVTWDQAANSKHDTFPGTLEWGPMPPPVVAKPGITELI